MVRGQQAFQSETRQRSYTGMTMADISSRPITSCQICDNSSLQSILFLGYIPPVNTMPKVGSVAEEQPAYPLELLRCRECGHAQIGLEVDAEVLRGGAAEPPGLNLPAMLEAVTAQGGWISIAPGPGHTTITLYLRAALELYPNPAEEPLGSEGPHGARAESGKRDEEIEESRGEPFSQPLGR